MYKVLENITNMMSVSLLRGLRAPTVIHSFRRSLLTAPGHGTRFSGTELKRVVGVGVPLLTRNLQPVKPSSRYLCTTAEPQEGNLIYKATLGKAIQGVKMFSYTGSGLCLLVFPQIFWKTGTAIDVILTCFIGFVTFGTPLLFHLLIKGYVVRLYHRPDTDTYTAVTISALIRERKTVFHQSQVRIPGVSSLLTTFYADKMGMAVTPEFFDSPQDYNHLMGYDKPFDFSSDDIDKPAH